MTHRPKSLLRQVDPKDGKIYVCVRVRVCWEGGGGEIVSSLGLWEYNRHMHHPSFPPSPLPPSLTGKNRLPTFQSKKNKHDGTHSYFSRILVKLGYLLSFLLTYIHIYIHTYISYSITCFFVFFFFLANGGPQALSKDVLKSLLLKYSVEV